ncbi:hypothetical protein OCHUTO_0412 [Orientia chuto str. Dubai]|uniref:Uncharacterized protein n=1 Tax=Orientia chuto str. Dubai TaxID=1359168 RepID=A0A0F3MLH3_9RICK|nr:hypothetical protein [Candidatus Orientia mediorientalis]KJV56565.1 hypothetical protein OCHUTO_0412 [Orientia chuto str. Dubai]
MQHTVYDIIINDCNIAKNNSSNIGIIFFIVLLEILFQQGGKI